jgi:hypothetical protein
VPRIFQVGFAVASLEGVFGTRQELLAEALLASWQPGASTTRYRRTWVLSRLRTQKGAVWTGRIGFVQEGEIITVVWNPIDQDFSHEAAASGVVVPFAINVSTGLIAFQLISGVVRPTTFTMALQSILNLNPTYRWNIEPLAFQRSFEEWRERVPVVSEFSFRLEVPNPRYVNEPEVERLLEQLRLQVATLVGKARDGESINLDADLFKQSLDHVRRKYGRGVIRGRDDAGIETEWDSSRGGTVPVRRRVSSEGEEQILDEDLIRELSQAESIIGDLVRGEPEEDETTR